MKYPKYLKKVSQEILFKNINFFTR